MNCSLVVQHGTEQIRITSTAIAGAAAAAAAGRPHRGVGTASIFAQGCAWSYLSVLRITAINVVRGALLPGGV